MQRLVIILGLVFLGTNVMGDDLNTTTKIPLDQQVKQMNQYKKQWHNQQRIEIIQTQNTQEVLQSQKINQHQTHNQLDATLKETIPSFNGKIVK